MHGEDKHLRGPSLRADPPGDLQAADAREGEVHDHHVWVKCLGRDQGFFARSEVSHKRYLGCALKQGSEPLADDLMVVHEKDGDTHRSPLAPYSPR